MPENDDLRYPIGEFTYGQTYTFDQTQEHIAAIAVFPHNLTELVGRWGDSRLDTPYRPGGWTVRQLIHHVADSHINAYTRTKLALTEDVPTIKPYEEQDWAKLPDYTLSVAPSLVILSNLHQRWVMVLNALTETELRRQYFHPASQLRFSLSEAIANYAWHGEHHYQHAYQLALRNHWV
ncbi:YfiT family bacillithiol transferase [Larkinella terrae]|uniref:Putative metal-dependent hydrolase n=1 Tax=Larkinella terrae TaxID=2025311 RepID=A0A7K0ETK1_9BACT|nr:putative metal-dependent hydrolase [Larkinella terrae]MRS65092.1 putative metal-dependent hydrolase [Larkinella terrae]